MNDERRGTTDRGADGEVFPEWMDIHPSRPLRQGDVLVAVVPNSDEWHKLLIVLTADCDLAREKHGGALTCVSVLPKDSYLIWFRYENQRNLLCDRLAEQLISVYDQNANEEPKAQVSRWRMREWVVESHPSIVADELGLDPGKTSQFIALAEPIRDLTASAPDTIGTAVDKLAKAKHALGDSATREKADAAVRKDLSQFLRSLPGDAIYLNELSLEHSSGYVAYLRRVIEVNDCAVVTSQSRIPHDAAYLRVARLRSPYIYALTQQFAAVFSAIGLPSAYESARNRSLTELKNGGD